MKILFDSNRDRIDFSSESSLFRRFGKAHALKIERIMTYFRNADTLTDVAKIRSLRLHHLVGEYRHNFTVDVDGIWRLIFWGLDSSGQFTLVKHQAVAVRIRKVVDYH